MKPKLPLSKKRVNPRKHPIEFDKNVLPKNIQWMHDFDYLRKLPPKEQEFMAKFIREFVNGNVKKGDRKALHKTAKLRRDCYQKKNAQNRDLMSILNSGGKMDRIDENEEPTSIVKEAFRRLDSKQRRKPKQSSRD